MNFKGQHTGGLFTFLAGLIILAHAVVPHHHHFDSVETHPENQECENTRPDKHNENPDTHCHALNLIISEKANDLVVNSPVTSIFHFNLFSFDIELYIASKINDVIHPPFVSSLTQKQIFLASRSLRAPPVTV